MRAVVASLLYGFPAKKLKLIGVTGTDGKTTTSWMIYYILKKCKKEVGLITTTSIDVGRGIENNFAHSTTPDVFLLQKLLNNAVNNGLEYMVLEVSSHGLEQHRLWGCVFEVGVITNLTREHLDYHKSMKRYLRAKSKLFDQSNWAIFNKDDKSFAYLSKRFKKFTSYSLQKKADLNLKNLKNGLKFEEKYNQYNALGAISVCKRLGVPTGESVKILESFSFPPGRQEIIQKKPFLVMVDFAHTPNGLKQLMAGIKKSGGRLIHVFGCPGQRDKGKRVLMGQISSEYSEVMILTAEDPRDEKVESINLEIRAGVKSGYKGRILSIFDRTRAIQKAINMAEKGDIVLFTGKGAEKTQELGGRVIPWDEVEVVKKALKK